MADDIRNRFQRKAMTSKEINSYNIIADHLEDLAIYISQNLKDSRETSMVLTKLEEAAFWTNASLSRNGLKK